MSPDLYASIDLGSNSFKLLIVTNRFIPILRINSSVVLAAKNSSKETEKRAIEALRRFHTIIKEHNVNPYNTRHVATEAVRNASERLLDTLRGTIGTEFDIEVVSGEEEARLTYLGVVQSRHVFDVKVLVVDIGGGSTEFVVGKEGGVLFGISLRLGHVMLSEEFARFNRIDEMREHIRSVIRESGLVQELDKHGFEVVIGSSGTIRAIEKAVYNGYGKELNVINDLNSFEVYKRDWKFSRGDLSDLVQRLCCEDGEMERKVDREKVFKKRSESIVAAAVLLEEIFGMLGIKVMEVSRYSLCEGVIAERLAGSLGNYDLNADARLQSVLCLGSRFNSKKKMRSAAFCAALAKEMFESVKKWNEVGVGEHRLGVSIHDKDLEYLEAACLLHSIGVITGKKGYHKQSYHIIMNGGHLHGYDIDEIKIVALLSRHHRKKFPQMDHHSLKGFTKEFKHKFRILCAILRVSIVLQQYIPVRIQDIKVLHSEEGFKLVLGELSYQPFIPGNAQTSPEDADREIAQELETFYGVFHQKLTVLVPSSSLESSKGGAFVDDTSTPQL